VTAYPEYSLANPSATCGSETKASIIECFAGYIRDPQAQVPPPLTATCQLTSVSQKAGQAPLTSGVPVLRSHYIRRATELAACGQGLPARLLPPNFAVGEDRLWRSGAGADLRAQ
jgi:hypothetical protein